MALVKNINATQFSKLHKRLLDVNAASMVHYKMCRKGCGAALTKLTHQDIDLYLKKKKVKVIFNTSMEMKNVSTR